jgi:hypothetical protein
MCDFASVWCGNRLGSPRSRDDFVGRPKPEWRMMGQTTHHYLIFETASGFCGIAWNGVGVTVAGAPTPTIAEAVAAAKRYFEGEETDFSGFKLDLDEQGAFFEQVYAAARRVGWGHTTTHWRRNPAPGQRPLETSARTWPGTRCRHESRSPAWDRTRTPSGRSQAFPLQPHAHPDRRACG